MIPAEWGMLDRTIPIRAFGLAAVVLGGCLASAAGLEARVSNHSWVECISLTKLKEPGVEDDVKVSVEPAQATGEAKAGGPSGSAATCWVLAPGETARITLGTPPVEGQAPRRRTLILAREEGQGEVTLTFRAGLEKGQPTAVLEYEPDPESGMDFDQAAPDHLVYCGARMPGLCGAERD
jgi:hypothetical protein